jgi:hypothetical protein
MAKKKTAAVPSEASLEVRPASKDTGPDKYEIESMARTLLEAEEIKGDADKMKHVHKHLGKKSEAMHKVIGGMAGLKARGNKMAHGTKVDGSDIDE